MGNLKFKYFLSKRGLEKCIKGEFYGQATPQYRGYTEKIFYTIFRNNNIPLTQGEISILSNVPTRKVNGTLKYNINSGFILKIAI